MSRTAEWKFRELSSTIDTVNPLIHNIVLANESMVKSVKGGCLTKERWLGLDPTETFPYTRHDHLKHEIWSNKELNRQFIKRLGSRLLENEGDVDLSCYQLIGKEIKLALCIEHWCLQSTHRALLVHAISSDTIMSTWFRSTFDCQSVIEFRKKKVH